MGKVEENKKKKKDALLAAAFTLFTEKGIHETSISDIARKAQLAKGTFYLYFKDKYDIEKRLIAKKASQIFEEAYYHVQSIQDVQDGKTGFEDEVVYLVDYIVDLLNEDKALLKFLSKNLGWGVFYHALTSPRESDELNFSIVYEKLLQDSGHKYRRPDLMIYMIVEIVSSTIYNVILYEEPVSLEILKPELYEVIRQIVRGQEIA